MWNKSLQCWDNQYIIITEGTICSSPRELMASEIFVRLVREFVVALRRNDSVAFRELFGSMSTSTAADRAVRLLRLLADHPLEGLLDEVPLARVFRGKNDQLVDFVEELYNFWREKERFLLCKSDQGPWAYDTRPYRTFNATVEQLTHVVRATYRDILENITSDIRRVYRQVRAGAQAGVIAVPKPWNNPGGPYAQLAGVPFVRQVWISPPMIIDPPVNKRTGQFERVERNPLEGLRIDPDQWLCFPVQVGPLVMFVYFHLEFFGLGLSLANLFELANDEEIERGPDAVYLYGADPEHMAAFGDLPTVFHEDFEHGLLAAAIPREKRFGYFGYLKKMVLTLHNVVMMRRGMMPYHGAMCRILLRGGSSANVVLMGDTATGKSETLEALRGLGRSRIQSLKIVADDMGTMAVDEEAGVLRGYGTEIGAFIRLDDLQAGYAFGQIDRAIIMSPHRTNARVVLPITTMREVLRGYRVDYLLYANNYEPVDQAHPVLERFEDREPALETFRRGRAMAKGTTTSTGLVESYFANIFGPPQYRELHDPLAGRIFDFAFRHGIWVGQLRTRLGLEGWETKGPEASARELLKLIGARKKAPAGA